MGHCTPLELSGCKLQNLLESCLGHCLQHPLKEAQAPSTATQLEGSSRSIVDQRVQKDLH